MKYLYYLVLVLLLIGIYSCEDIYDDNSQNRFVIEAFIYAGEPVMGIKIKKSVPLMYPDSVAEAITDAEVLLIKEEITYGLTATENGDYKYPGKDLAVETGDVFEIRVTYNGMTATGITIVPSPTTGLKIDIDKIILPDISFQPGQGGGQGGALNALLEILSGSIIVEWDNPDEDLYFMVVENLVEELDPIFPDRIANRLRRFRYISRPTRENFIEFSLGNLETFGEHIIKVYHINQEYAALYENLKQDSRDLNEPPSNIINGLGIFSAFNSQNIYFTVAREE